MNANMRSPSAMAMGDRPLVDARPKDAPNAGGLLAAEQSRPGAGGFGGGWFNNGMGGVQLGQQSSMPAAGMNGMGGYFASPTAAATGAGMQYAGYGMQYPQQQQMMMQQQQQQAMYAQPQQQQYYMPTYNAMPTNMQNSGWVGNAYNPGMMGGTYASFAQQNISPLAAMGMGVDEEGLSSDQRTAIDRWRMGVAHQ